MSVDGQKNIVSSGALSFLFCNGMFDPIQELVTDAVVHPTKYNLGTQTASIPNNAKQSDTPNLSGGIAQKLRDRHEIDTSIALRIQVTAKSVDYSKLGQPHYHIIKRFTLHVIDGDGKKINVKVNLTPGTNRHQRTLNVYRRCHYFFSFSWVPGCAS
jgi:hypothetical protein